jgi:hypothetical protein
MAWSGPVRLQSLAEGQVDQRRLRELRSAAEATPLRVEPIGQFVCGRSQQIGRAGPVDGIEQRVGSGPGLDDRPGDDSPGQFLGLLFHLGTPIGPDVIQSVEHGGEGWTTVVVGRREVRPAVEGAAVGGEEDAHGPAAGAGDGLDSLHVDGVDVGPLLAVDLDADEAVVEAGCHYRILEGLVGHDVAPVAGRVADRQEDRLVLGRRSRERLFAPRIPVDRIVGVLAQIGAGFDSQAVGVHRKERIQMPTCRRRV